MVLVQLACSVASVLRLGRTSLSQCILPNPEHGVVEANQKLSSGTDAKRVRKQSRVSSVKGQGRNI